jgi:hypothetical protein
MQPRKKMSIGKTGLYSVPFHICRGDGATHSKTGRLVTLSYAEQKTMMQALHKARTTRLQVDLQVCGEAHRAYKTLMRDKKASRLK